ncbi:MAG: hypothetical protein LBL58_03025 [Tannerellaceae bacterium]|jgi:hypothetical protein|nr:hypothetical protein [Tannerellaceae bacterium]
MNYINKFFILTGLTVCFFVACDDEYGPRKESAPVIESAAIQPSTFTFGDSVTLSAKVFDPATMLTTLKYEMVSGGKVLASGTIPLVGDITEVSYPLIVSLQSGQSDNASITVNLIAENVLKGATTSEITGLTGNRPSYSRLYLVTDEGTAVTLLPQSGSKDKFEGTNLTLDGSFRFRLAEKLNADNTIDYSGDVYGNVNGRMGMIDERGESAFAYTSGGAYTKTFVYDNVSFDVSTTGGTVGIDDWALSAFSNEDIFNESFRTLKRSLETGKTYTLVGTLAEAANFYNPDFFERVSANQVKFLGESGEYTLYYNPVRKNVFVGVDEPAYPQYLLACGYGLGYPTNVTSAEIGAVYPGHNRVHTEWGFGNVMNYVLMRRIADNVYQGTFFTPGDHDHYAGFKPFENTGWGNEKKAGEFTFTGEPIITGDNDWTIPNGDEDPLTESANYRFTIDLSKKTVHVEKVTWR